MSSTKVYNLNETTDFLLEVGKGNKLGHSFSAVIMKNPSCSSTVLSDVWGGSGNMILPSAAESWEIVSSSVNDTAAGSGARTVLISSLDDDYGVQTPQVVTLDGQTPVALTGTHFRPHPLSATSTIFVLTAGSKETNEGLITLRVSGAGATRSVILADSGASDAGSISEDSQIAVPAGVTLFGLKVIIDWPVNQSGDVTTSIKPFGADTARISSGRLPLYQNVLDLNFRALFQFTEKTDFSFRALSTNSGSELSVIEEFLIVENEFLDLDAINFMFGM